MEISGMNNSSAGTRNALDERLINLGPDKCS